VRASILVGCSLGAAAIAIAGCSPYDPDLGNAPYLCAAQEPRCPDGYTCMDSGGQALCVANDGLPPDPKPDGQSGFECAEDGQLEPNNTAMEAFQTDVGLSAPTRVYGPLSLCPEGDEDYYQINIITANKGIEMIVRWDSGTPMVACSLLLRSGDPRNPLKDCSTMGLTGQRACVTNLPVDVYYAYVHSPGNAKNNYRVELKLVDACL
jgi:hypothetical protein